MKPEPISLMDRHLVIFLRRPQLGRGKTRLARDIGPIGALRFARRSAVRLIAALGRDARWTTWLAVTPDAAATGPHPWAEAGIAARRTAQGGGDLGARMARQFRRHRGRVVIVGGDLPDLTRPDIARAFAALGTADVVLGPATDGGYWLIGARPGVDGARLFRNVRWSSPTTRAETLANLDPRHRAVLLDMREDVDDGASLARNIALSPAHG